MLPRMASLTNTPLSSGEDVSNGFVASPTSDLRRHSLECVPSSSSASRAWFHGEMGKREAEEILKSCDPGSFLVRMEPLSKYSPVKYYISMTTPEDISHLPISYVNRQFFFMGEPYSSLSELVAAFRNTGAQPVTSGHSLYEDCFGSGEMTRYICMCTFEGDSNSEEISALAGDVLTGMEDDGSHWVLARNERTDAHGFIPSYVLSYLVCTTEEIVDLPYFHNPVTKDVLPKMVAMGPGSFFLRHSSKGEGSFALSVNTRAGQVEKFLIRTANDAQGGFILAGRRFSTVQQIIERYCRYPITCGLRLTHAVFATPSSDSSLPWSVETTPEEEHRSIVVDDEVASTSRTVATVQALRKSREEKPWKPCWLTLRDDPHGCCHLVVSDDETASRARVVLDLPFSVFYALDESVFGREGCLFLSQNDVDVPGVYLSIRPFPVFAEWVTLLRSRMLGLQPGSLPLLNNNLQFELPKAPNLCVMRIYIDKYKSDALKTESTYSAYGSVNGVKVCTTQLLSPSGRSSPSLVFDASFLIPFSPAGAGSFQISLLSHTNGKKSRAFGISPLLALPDAELTSYSFDQGFSLRIARNSVAVAPDEDYQLLCDWLKKPGVEFLEFVSDALSTQDRALFCLSLVSSLITQPTLLLQFIEALLTEILANALPENVLRQDSLATSLLTHSLRVVARHSLETALEKSGISTTRMPDSHDVESVVSCITGIAEDAVASHVLALVKRLAVERFGDQEHVVRRVLSAVMILRFANPLILGFYQGLPIGQHLAKGVQAAANTACSRSPSSPEELPHAAALRDMFDHVGHNLVVLPATSSAPNHDWLCIACHLMCAVVSSKTELPPVPEEILRVILAHKPIACS